MPITPRPQKPLPRGIRNNNPLNIRIGNVWLGEVNSPDDPEFEQFVSMKYGLRAAFVLLRRYIRHYKRTTIEAIIRAWAPPVENSTDLYIANVSHTLGVLPAAEVHFSDKVLMCRLVQAMAKMETGTVLDMKLIESAYDCA